MSNQEIAIQSGVHGKSYPAEFNRLFPGATNLISYYTGGAGVPKWTSQTGLYNRYVFRMQHTIEFDSHRTNIVSVGIPKFYLYEMKEINLLPGDRYYLKVARQTELGIDAWQKLVAANGDFKAAGIILETNKPIENFEAAWWKL